jgi:hypothetical protein
MSSKSAICRRAPAITAVALISAGASALHAE